MSEESRAALTMGLWFLSTIAEIAIFISAGMMGAFAPLHIIFAVIILALAVGGTPLILRLKSDEPEQEKAKRQRIDKLLRDMSDDDLLALKQRLSEGEFSDGEMLDYLSDDGELIVRR